MNKHQMKLIIKQREKIIARYKRLDKMTTDERCKKDYANRILEEEKEIQNIRQNYKNLKCEIYDFMTLREKWQYNRDLKNIRLRDLDIATQENFEAKNQDEIILLSYDDMSRKRKT